jgi:porphobilinogen deaminase
MTHDHASALRKRTSELIQPILRALAVNSPTHLRRAEMALLDYLDGQCALRVAAVYEYQHGLGPAATRDTEAA